MCKYVKSWRLAGLVGFFVVFGAVCCSQAGWKSTSAAPIIDENSLGITADGVYLHAYNVANTDAAVIHSGQANQLTFAGTNHAANADVMSNLVITGNGTNAYAHTPGVYTGELLKLLTHSTYAGTRNYKLYGVIPGLDYEISILGHKAEEVRSSYISVDGQDREMIYAYDAGTGRTPEGVFATWTGTATSPSGNMVVEIVGDGNDTWHVTGIMSKAIIPDNVILATGFGGQNGQWRDQRAVEGTSMDHYNAFGADKQWIARGAGQKAAIWGAYGGPESGDGTVNFDIGTDNKAMQYMGRNAIVVMWQNTAFATDFAADLLSTNHIMLTADLSPHGSNGIGMGFFDSQNFDGTATTGFTGLMLDQNGALSFMNNGAAGVTSVGYGGTWDGKDDFNSLIMELLLNPDGTATLLDLSLEGSSADYSALIDSVFPLTDQVGFVSLGGWGAVDNFVAYALQPMGGGDGSSVPEPATWVMLLLAASWLGFKTIRRKG